MCGPDMCIWDTLRWGYFAKENYERGCDALLNANTASSLIEKTLYVKCISIFFSASGDDKGH